MSNRPVRGRVLSVGWWLRAGNGRVVIAQWPNAALWVWIAAALLTSTGQFAAHRSGLTGVARGALIVWGLDELVRGVNPFRRVLGAVVLGAQVATLA